jgi:hypothetical protein
MPMTLSHPVKPMSSYVGSLGCTEALLLGNIARQIA